MCTNLIFLFFLAIDVCSRRLKLPAYCVHLAFLVVRVKPRQRPGSLVFRWFPLRPTLLHSPFTTARTGLYYWGSECLQRRSALGWQAHRGDRVNFGSVNAIVHSLFSLCRRMESPPRRVQKERPGCYPTVEPREKKTSQEASLLAS